MENHANNTIIKTAKNFHMRIAIIGAGAAGLTVAETLKEKGYTHVTIFEKNAFAGGKCSSVDIDGHIYELGAGIIEEQNKTVIRLAKKYQVDMRAVQFGKSIAVDSLTGKELKHRTWKQTIILLWQILVRYRKLCSRFQYISKPGFSSQDADLALPFSVFAKKYNIEACAYELSLFFTGFGYGYFDDTPTAYVLKYYSWNTLKSFVKRRMFQFPHGIQHIWTTVASHHDVVYQSDIKHIKRTQNTVEICFNSDDVKNKIETFDALIVTSAFDELSKFLDVSEQEKILSSHIEYVDYRTIACSLKNFSKTTGYVPGNFTASRAGHPVFWYHRHHDTDIYTFYVLGDWHISDEDVIKNIKSFVGKQNAYIQDVYSISHWKYFPHVYSNNIQQGFFEQLTALQGNKQTYYAGELFNFSTVGLTSQYAEYMVQTYF